MLAYHVLQLLVNEQLSHRGAFIDSLNDQTHLKSFLLNKFTIFNLFYSPDEIYGQVGVA